MHHIVFKNVSLPYVVYTITILLRRRRSVSAHDDNSPFSFRTRARTLKIIFKFEEILRDMTDWASWSNCGRNYL